MSKVLQLLKQISRLRRAKLHVEGVGQTKDGSVSRGKIVISAMEEGIKVGISHPATAVGNPGECVLCDAPVFDLLWEGLRNDRPQDFKAPEAPPPEDDNGVELEGCYKVTLCQKCWMNHNVKYIVARYDHPTMGHCCKNTHYGVAPVKQESYCLTSRCPVCRHESPSPCNP